MRTRALLGLTAIAALAAALAANPPPGEVLGRSVDTVAWVALLAVGAIGAALTLALPTRRLAYVGVSLLALPLLGPVHDLATGGFAATLVGAWAIALHLELVAFARRREWWVARLADEPEAVAAYERAYVRALLRLALVSLVGLWLVTGTFWLLRLAAPTTFALSLEARHVEGMAAFLLLAGAAVAGVMLVARRPRESASPISEAPP